MIMKTARFKGYSTKNSCAKDLSERISCKRAIVRELRDSTRIKALIIHIITGMGQMFDVILKFKIDPRFV